MIEEELKKRSDKIHGEDIREDIEVFQKGQIDTLEMMEVPDSQNGNMVKTQICVLILTKRNLGPLKYWYGKGEFHRIKIEQPKFWGFKTFVLNNL